VEAFLADVAAQFEGHIRDVVREPLDSPDSLEPLSGFEVRW
jgi:phosphoribosylaminoimidazole carboxylase (NCAIR synthetase)